MGQSLALEYCSLHSPWILGEVCYLLISVPWFGHLMTTGCLPVEGVGGGCAGALLPSSCGQGAGLLLPSHLCSGLVSVQSLWAWRKQVIPWCLPHWLLSLMSLLLIQIILLILALLFLLVLSHTDTSIHASFRPILTFLLQIPTLEGQRTLTNPSLSVLWVGIEYHPPKTINI